MKITANGGHYPGLDSGAIGASGLCEADVTKDMMNRIALRLSDIGHDVYMVQENELYQITDASNDFGADLFVSIHCNAAENIDARGTETFCYSVGGDGERLANCVQKHIIGDMGTIDRNVKVANFAVLRDTNCPAILIELAFISNIDDEALLLDSTKLDLFADSIVAGILEYIG